MDEIKELLEILQLLADCYKLLRALLKHHRPRDSEEESNLVAEDVDPCQHDQTKPPRSG